jgi:hypothetical protein
MASRFRKRFLSSSPAKETDEKEVPEVTHRKDFLSQHSFRDLNAKPKEDDYVEQRGK